MNKVIYNKRSLLGKFPVFVCMSITALWQVAGAQIPDKFENLTVFPKDIGQRELINNMKGFASGLGVRCNYCHVGEGDDLSTFDFASDEKQPKKTARVMLKMRNDINRKYLTQLTKNHSLQVNCVTCHHGQPRPQTLGQVLNEVVSEKGVEAAIEKYRELRERYYGGSTYDFQALTLLLFAHELAEQEKLDAALAFLNLNVELYPEFAMSYVGLGEAYMRKEEQVLAVANFKKALELDPNNRHAKMRLDQLSKK